ncbi:hypothetical protein [uncultured Draconibacterium sp.]|uniref:hypothetical protein n=1 Tax=uncultured Draconibacterium sp. TaxID=1573823 RepID=UPI0025D95E4C|nr:hypothetical protein [uncultured Draconibacterium sp.]
MLGYYLNNKPFLLDDDTSVRLTWLNPACNFEEFKGDKGMGIDIPVNDPNRALLGNPERFEKYANTNDREFPNFEIRFSGKLLMAGTLVINKADDEQYSGWLRGVVGNLKKEHQEKYIYDIDAFDQDVDLELNSFPNSSTDDYCLPRLKNTKFFYDKGRNKNVPTEIENPDWYYGSKLDEYTTEDIETAIYDLAFKRTANSMVNQHPPLVIPESTVAAYAVELYLDVYVISPMLFLNYVLKELMRDAGFYIDRNDIADDPSLSKLFIYNNFDIGVFDYVKENEEQFGYNTDPFDGGGNTLYFLIQDIHRHYPSFKYKWLLPKIQLKEFIIGLQNMLNVCFQFKQNGKVDIIDREQIITKQAFDISKYLVGNWAMDERKDVSLKFSFEHDEDDTFFQDNWEDIDDRRDDVEAALDNWEDLPELADPEVGDIRYLKELDIYVEYCLIQESYGSQMSGNQMIEDRLGWKRISYGFQHGFINRADDKEEEEIETVFSTLFNNGTDTVTYQPGNTRGKRFLYQNFSPRLLFHNGQNSCSNTDSTNGLMLDWLKEGIGLLAKRYPKWGRFWSTRQPASRKSMLPLNVLDYMVRNITDPYTSKEGDFIIEKMEATVYKHHVGVTTIDVYKK